MPDLPFAHDRQSSKDPLLFQEFVDPPASARPRAWWHWMDGNVDEAGIVKDLEWLAASGVGGVQAFNGSMGTPAYVPETVVFRSPAWQSAMRCAADTADRLGLELSVATSAGWSATGGPWVRPAAGMKKLVWSTARVSATDRRPLALPVPPSISGPFQDVPFRAVRGTEVEIPDHYEEVAVVALPHRECHQPVLPARLTASGPVSGERTLDSLADGRFWPAIDLSATASAEREDPGSGWVLLDFNEPVAVASIRVGLPARHGFGSSPAPLAWLEASNDGTTFSTVVELPSSPSPVRSAAFPAVTARYFRLLLQDRVGFSFPFAPGVRPLKFSDPEGQNLLFQLSGLQLFPGPRVNRAEEKAGFAPVPDFYALEGGPYEAAAVQPEEVIDLSDRLQQDGTLDWEPQQGDWTVIRFGYSLTGHLNGPAPVDATGLEVDKLDGGLVTDYIEQYLGFFDEALGQELIGSQGVTALLSDSIESGPQNWTSAMREEFRSRRGYDLLPWLPTVSGVLVGGAERSDAFLWDFRRTIAELLAEKHYGTLARVAHARGMGYYAEALEDHRPQLGDDLEIRSHADVPMGAMWCYEPENGPQPTYVADLQGASSVANIYGKAAVGAESMSAFGKPFMFTPRNLKPVVDMEFSLGVNLVNIHTSPHQPDAAPKPGVTLSPYLGQSFTRNETWAHAARPWIDYIARCSHLLQQGTHAADIAYFYGEEAPVTGVFGDSAPEVPEGYGFDFINLDGLLNHITVTSDGHLLSAGGVSYRLLYLGGTSHRMTLAAVQRITELLDAGATVAGWRPESSPSEGDDREEWAAAVDALWSRQRPGLLDLDGVSTADGLVIGLTRIKVRPDWVLGTDDDSNLAVIHRRLDEGELYFVSNQLDRPEKIRAAFRVEAKTAELWDPVSARRETASIITGESEATALDIELDAFGSVFVLLGYDSSHQTPCPEQPDVPEWAEVPVHGQELDGPWRVEFDADSQSANPLILAAAEPWSGPLAPDYPSGVKHFSGKAVYSHTFDLKLTSGSGFRLVLEISDVHDLAEVCLNGRDLGVLWTPPFRMDVTDAARTGQNLLEIAVTNSWANRLIGDAAAGVTARPGAHVFEPDADTLPAGLQGPVRLVAYRE
ncbi:glycosyl hydrolase [Paenarthrobacter nitroguajacolicus]|uniref:glycosyl hydrolase n=1 Tax=Paenarthrobacter nitroguajacolicus TaxID=211146 RepID=UPI002863C497|nr:glycosyl hydrolase [Paenarthrobacter nitroguajacolicus]MDR6639466.1 hypothetical protein [Paenarthrobacter nitroguajacolicus]